MKPNYSITSTGPPNIANMRIDKSPPTQKRASTHAKMKNTGAGACIDSDLKV